MSVSINLEEGLGRALSINSDRRFKQSVELIVNVKDIDLSKPENRFTEVVELPHSLGSKARKIAVIASGNLALQAQRSKNVDKVFERGEIESMIGNKKLAKKVARQYDYILVEPSLVSVAARALGTALGSRGKSPVPIPPGSDVDELAAKYKRSVTLRLRKVPQLACIIGTEEMGLSEILDNARSVLNRIVEKLDKRWNSIKSIYVKKTMESPVKIEFYTKRKRG